MAAENLPGPGLLTVVTRHGETVHVQIINKNARTETQLISDVIYSSEDLEKHPEIKDNVGYDRLPVT